VEVRLGGEVALPFARALRVVGATPGHVRLAVAAAARSRISAASGC
jgi:protein involved in polysaccharide export with SLBB domain